MNPTNAWEYALDRVDRGVASEQEQALVAVMRAVFPGDFTQKLCGYELNLWMTAMAEDLTHHRPEFARKHADALRRLANDETAPARARDIAEGLLAALGEG